MSCHPNYDAATAPKLPKDLVSGADSVPDPSIHQTVENVGSSPNCRIGISIGLGVPDRPQVTDQPIRVILQGRVRSFLSDFTETVR